MRTSRILTAVLLAATLAVASAAAQNEAGLSPEAARQVLDAALGYARGHAAPGGAIAVVDASGALVLFQRLDGTFPAASRVAVGKAQTAALFRKPTKAFEDAINGGRTALGSVPDFYPLQGGVPLVVRGQIVGAIGVSGAASADQDTEIATAGAAALETGRVGS